MDRGKKESDERRGYHDNVRMERKRDRDVTVSELNIQQSEISHLSSPACRGARPLLRPSDLLLMRSVCSGRPRTRCKSERRAVAHSGAAAKRRRPSVCSAAPMLIHLSQFMLPSNANVSFKF